MSAVKQEMIQKLRDGESIVGYKESGNSMNPIICHRQPVTISPVDTSLLEEGDVVFCKVRGKFFLHKVTAIRGEEVQIGNNKGGINGWTSRDKVYGIVSEVDGREIRAAHSKILEPASLENNKEFE